MTDAPDSPTAARGVSRRTVNAAAWMVPVVSLAVATPASAASGVDVGAYVLLGSCGLPGVVGPGFTLTAGSGDLPVDTVIIVTGRDVANIGVFSATPRIATVTVLSGTSRLITLTSPLAAGAVLGLRTTLSTSVPFTLNAVVTLPDGYTGTGAKSTGSVDSTYAGCSGS